MVIVVIILVWTGWLVADDFSSHTPNMKNTWWRTIEQNHWENNGNPNHDAIMDRTSGKWW